MDQAVTLTVNGQTHTLTVEPETPLLYILRNDLGLKSPKFGCGLEQCGACKVIINGEAVPSCRLPVALAQGREIVTLEGLGTLEALHPVQQAFLEEQAAQCGFCTAGMIVAAAALLDQTPHPDETDIRQALAVNLCRCGTYHRVLRAIQRAAGE
jgi:aerobic-type carbon monoxide dehydrogenase small subunit (CoxS/CutS family)